MINFNQRNMTEQAIRDSLGKKLTGNDYDKEEILVSTVWFNFTTHLEESEGTQVRDGELEHTRKIVVRRSSPTHALEVLGAFFSQLITLDCHERYLPDRYRLDRKIQDLFNDVAQTREFNEAMRQAYTSCKTVTFYASIVSENTYMLLEDSVHIERAYQGGRIANQVLTLLASAIGTAVLIFFGMRR